MTNFEKLVKQLTPENLFDDFNLDSHCSFCKAFNYCQSHSSKDIPDCKESFISWANAEATQ